MFGGDIEVRHREKSVTVDDWIEFQVKHVTSSALYTVYNRFVYVQAFAKTGVIFKELRSILDDLLARKFSEPTLDLTGYLCN